jgi:hypothetical protein
VSDTSSVGLDAPLAGVDGGSDHCDRVRGGETVDGREVEIGRVPVVLEVAQPKDH